MGKRTAYRAGPFSRVDLGCKNLGWTYRDIKADVGSIFSQALVDDAPVAALYTGGAEQASPLT